MNSNRIRPESESDRTAESVVGSNERTNERTDVEIGPDVNHDTALDARARIGICTGTLGDLLTDGGEPRRDATIEAVRELTTALTNRNDGRHPFRMLAAVTREWDDRYQFTQEQERWPLIRTGEREPLPILIRSSVLRRDQYACGNCGLDMGGKGDRENIEVDHCVPWSAGGPHDSDNLRVLCRSCNQRRSNLIDIAHLRAYRPTTWWCFDCWSSESYDERHRWPWRNGIDLGRVLYVDDERAPSPEQVFCAFCEHYTLSPYPLVGRLGRRLIEQTDPRLPRVRTTADAETSPEEDA